MSHSPEGQSFFTTDVYLADKRKQCKDGEALDFLSRVHSLLPSEEALNFGILVSLRCEHSSVVFARNGRERESDRVGHPLHGTGVRH